MPRRFEVFRYSTATVCALARSRWVIRRRLLDSRRVKAPEELACKRDAEGFEKLWRKAMRSLQEINVDPRPREEPALEE